MYSFHGYLSQITVVVHSLSAATENKVTYKTTRLKAITHDFLQEVAVPIATDKTSL